MALAVLVWFERDRPGHDALREAHALATDLGAPLTVVAVATREPIVGCGRCLAGTVVWNGEMREIAEEELAAARLFLGVGNADGFEIRFEVAVGRHPIDALAAAARAHDASVIVLPRPAHRYMPTHPRRDLVRRLARLGPWEVRVATRAQVTA